MAFNISEFIGNVNQFGTVPTNRFEVIITPPPVLAGDVTASRLQYRAENVSIPGVTLDLTDTRRWGIGPREKFGTNINFTDISISFIEEDGNAIHKFLYKWTKSIFKFVGSTESASPSYYTEYKDNYATTMYIHVYNKMKQKTEIVRIEEAFPSGLSDISLGWADNNQLFRVKANFAFTRWRLISSGDLTNTPASIGTIVPT